jgi:hypothetical protein
MPSILENTLGWHDIVERNLFTNGIAIPVVSGSQAAF